MTLFNLATANTSRSFSLQLTCSVKLAHFHCFYDDPQIQMCFKKFLWAYIMHFNIQRVSCHRNKHFSLTSFPDNSRDCSKINSIVMTQIKISNFNSFLLYTLCPSCPLTNICNQNSKTKKSYTCMQCDANNGTQRTLTSSGFSCIKYCIFFTSNINFWHCWPIWIAQYILLSLC